MLKRTNDNVIPVDGVCSKVMRARNQGSNCNGSNNENNGQCIELIARLPWRERSPAFTTQFMKDQSLELDEKNFSY